MRRATKRAIEQGRELEREHRWPEALDTYREALSRDPVEGQLWKRLGRVHEACKSWLPAADAYRRAVTLGVDRESVYFRLGRALQQCGNWGEAREAYRMAEARGRQEPSLKGVRNRRLPHTERLALGLPSKPEYAFSLFRSARLARRLRIEELTAIELGVAGGNGLVAMDRHAEDIEKMLGVRIHVVGFDTGEGLVAPKDHRDMPYTFAEGNYAMDIDALRGRLHRARLILGDATKTVPKFLREELSAPLGTISFDMDLYHPTKQVLDVMGDDADEAWFLPRLPVYFDDVVGRNFQQYHEYGGELLAIREFNEGNQDNKIAEDRYFRTLPVNEEWHHGIYTMHRFGHDRYEDYVSSAGPGSLSLKDTKPRPARSEAVGA